MTRVALVKPPLRVPRGSYSTLACPPISLAYLAATLLERGVDVTIVDAVGLAPDRMVPARSPGFLRVGLSDREIADAIPAGARVIGVTSMFSEEWPLVREVTASIRRAFPDALIVAGGEHPTAAPEACLRDGAGIDLCVLGEGEETLAEVVDRASRGLSATGVAGTAAIEGGRLRLGPPRERLRDLDAIPRPAWHLVPIEAYLSRGLAFGIGRGRSVPLVVSRGCPYRCTFCSSARMWGTRWQPRSAKAVVDEMEWLARAWRVENFDLFDLSAIQRRDWVVAFCNELIQRRLGVTWQIPAGSRSEVLDGEVTRLLHRSGCRYLAYAPESGSPALLERVNKRISIPRMKESMRAAVAAGITVKCNMMIGFPDETRGEILETLHLCVELAGVGVHDLNMGPFCPYPGTPMFDDLVRSGRLAGLDDDLYDQLASYSDLTRTRSWSRHVGSAELAAYRWLGMALFYAASLGSHPGRVARLVADVATGRQHTRLARAMSDILARTAAATRPPAPGPSTGGSRGG